MSNSIVFFSLCFTQEFPRMLATTHRTHGVLRIFCWKLRVVIGSPDRVRPEAHSSRHDAPCGFEVLDRTANNWQGACMHVMRACMNGRRRRRRADA